ncbi:universal stress protein [Thermococcus indicus]|uniref:Universal stress protein n=1 Tax=Thermococcus indicus TaxID=2586643 RepID=A0A4Y5SNR2_9EURY|nr:universal stress protein [Thermococcus indicus]QDA32567.1 universal stress protein [Thermococcus indicus]
MDIFSRLIQRKFQNIAADRYEEITRRYREFLLLPEEFVLPEVRSILIPIDRFSGEIPEELYETLSAYSGASVTLVYISEKRTLALIEQTLGKEEAEKLRSAKMEFARALVLKIAPRLGELGLRIERRQFIGSKSDDVIRLMENDNFDLLVVSRSYGSEVTRTSPVSPVVLKIVQHLESPVIIY